MGDATFRRALDRGSAGESLDRTEALALAEACTPDRVHLMGEAALANRMRRFDGEATYVCNLQINPSNVCVGGCRFCDFSVRPGEEGAYRLEEPEILSRVAELEPVEVHVVGGLNREWDYRRSVDLVRRLRTACPEIHIKAFTAVEMDWFARTEKMEVGRVLEGFLEAGLDAMPGGGAEVFSERVRREHCPTKLSPEGWIEVHRSAHRLGIATNATMLAGLGETAAERVDHLLALRDAQEDSGGFSCFIPLAYQTGKRSAWERALSPLEILGLTALSRLVLHNFPHVKAYWPMIGLETAAAALSWGADDLDGTIGGERIAHAAGARTPVALARDRMEETIRIGGFTPVERDGAFRPVEGGPR